MGGDNFVLGGVSGISHFPSNGEKPGWTVYVNMGKLDIFFLLLLLIPEASLLGRQFSVSAPSNGHISDSDDILTWR